MPELLRARPDGTLPAEGLRRAAEAARGGAVVGFPTDTVYGLGTSAMSREGVANIFRLKGRPTDKPLPLFASSAEEARRWTQWTPLAEDLARRFWPGGLTLVLKASPAADGLACRRGPTLAVRVPGHPLARALVEASGVPWAQTSANGSGEAPLPDGAAVARRFGAGVAVCVDAGPACGAESTVVDASGQAPQVLRDGAIPARELLYPPRRVLFVCTGNTCRSVMAEFLLRKLAADRGLALETLSAGVAAETYFQVPDGVRRALSAEGIATVDHTAQLVGRELLGWADLVLTMEDRHLGLLNDRFPEFRAKSRTLKGYAGRSGAPDVADPIGQSDQVYAACCREIKESLEVLLKRHAPHTQDPRP